MAFSRYSAPRGTPRVLIRVFSVPDRERSELSPIFFPSDIDIVNSTCGWPPAAYPDRLGNSGLFPFKYCLHGTVRKVPHPATQAQSAADITREGPEENPLHPSPDFNAGSRSILHPGHIIAQSLPNPESGQGGNLHELDSTIRMIPANMITAPRNLSPPLVSLKNTIPIMTPMRMLDLFRATIYAALEMLIATM